MIIKKFLFIAVLATCLSSIYALDGWSESCEFYLGTTEDWAHVPDSVTLVNFPLLVRLSDNDFNFSEMKANGEDIRFTKEDGTTILPLEIDTWDAAGGKAAIWVNIDSIKGNSLQTIKMWWGNASATAVSSSIAVFGLETNAIGGAYHFSTSAPFADASDQMNNGTNGGTTEAESIIGTARLFNRNQIELDSSVTPILGIGQGMVSFWIKTDTTIDGGSAWNSNALLGSDSPLTADSWWGVLDRGRVGMTPSSSDAPMSTSRVDDDFWHYVAVTRDALTGNVQTFVDGVLENEGALLAGDMHNNILKILGRSVNPVDTTPEIISLTDSGYVIGTFDEIRIIDTVRSASWIKLEYESQRSLPQFISQPQFGSCSKSFSVAKAKVNVDEGALTTVGGTADCALIAKWSLVSGDSLIPVKTDGLDAIIKAPRVSGTDTTLTYRFSGLYSDGSSTSWDTEDVEVTVKENIPDPEFTISIGDTTWDGLTPLVIYPEVSNLAAIQNSLAPDLNTVWTGAGLLVSANGVYLYGPNTSDTLVLTTPLNDGTLKVNLCLDNGGAVACDSLNVTVVKKDAFEFTSPTDADTIRIGNTYTISWNTNVPGATHVDIFFYPSFTAVQIADSIANTGTFEYTVPETISLPGFPTRFRITDAVGGLYTDLQGIQAVNIAPRPNLSGLTFYIKGQFPISLENENFTRIEIMDIRGNTIKSMPIRSNEIYWNKTTAKGNQAEPGFYLVRFVGDKVEKQVKMVLLNK